MTDEEWDLEVAHSALWSAAREYYLENKSHEFPTDNRLEVCIESGVQNDMEEHCWAILSAQYST